MHVFFPYTDRLYAVPSTQRRCLTYLDNLHGLFIVDLDHSFVFIFRDRPHLTLLLIHLADQ